MKIAETLKEAKEQSLTHYYTVCSKHGRQVFYTKDNVCKVCAKEGRDRRLKENYKFNMARLRLNQIRRRAKQRGIEVTLTVQDMRKLMETTHCPILGIKLAYEPGPLGDDSSSVDRLDPQKGYTAENCIMLSNRANVVKSNGTSEEHFRIAQFMRERNL